MNRNGSDDRGGPYRRGLISDSYPSSCRRLRSKLISKERGKNERKKERKGIKRTQKAIFIRFPYRLVKDWKKLSKLIRCSRDSGIILIVDLLEEL